MSRESVTKGFFLAFAQTKTFSRREQVVDVPWDQNSCISQLHICIKNTFSSSIVVSCKAEVLYKWYRNYRIIIFYQAVIKEDRYSSLMCFVEAI